MFKSAILAAVIGSAYASFETIKTFTPLTAVTDHAAISFDQTSMETLLGGGTEQSFASAQLVYTDGGNSKTAATLQIPGGLPINVASGAKLTAKGIDGRDVIGQANAAASAGATTIEFKYPVTTIGDDHLDCRQGGLPGNERIEDGCLLANGTFNIDGTATTVTYQYSVETDNDNDRTLAFFSTSANTRMRPGDDLSAPYFADFQKFFDYYGSFDYADRITTAAFDGTNTNLDNGNINIQSANIGLDGRKEIAKKGTAFLSVAMYVIRELEDAIYDCDTKCTIGQCNDDSSVHALDEAVAFYYGADDNFLHSLANKRCVNFATCAGDVPVEGDATVNAKVFQLFGQMQTHLQRGECDAARPLVNDISTQIWIPLIQGTLRYAWILDSTNNPGALLTEKAQGEGAIFAASILPVIHSCDPQAAATIYDNMKIQSQINVDYPAVKAAFESCYSDLGISCADIGGNVNNALNGYDAAATRPCDFGANNRFSASSASTVAVGSMISGSLLAVVVLLL
eukprot:scaffold3591_cov159-Amphora_coffeaeformis.AAC.9